MTRPTTPLLAADVIIGIGNREHRRIVLIKRKNPPYGWAIPGGFVDVGETVETAAVREALEETSTRVTLTALLGCYSDPKRDDRGHTASIVYLGETDDTPVAADDAAELAVFSINDLPSPMCFDHAAILDDYRHYLDYGVAPPIAPQALNKESGTP